MIHVADYQYSDESMLPDEIYNFFNNDEQDSS